MNNCHYCKGDKENGYTTHTADLGERCIVIRHVPCDRCVECGAETYSLSVAMELEAIVEEFRTSSRAEVAIVNYSKEQAA